MANGVTVLMKKVPTTNAAWTTAPYEAQFLKLFDVTPPPTPESPVPEGEYVIGTEVRFEWAEVAGADDNIVGYLVDIGTSPGGADVISGMEVEQNSMTFSGSVGQTLYATVRAVSAAGIESVSAGSSAATPVILLDAGGDEDGDGSSNGDEDLAGTDPLDAMSRFEIAAVELDDGAANVRFASVVGRSYRLECSGDLAGWEPVGVAVAGSGEELILSDPDGSEVRKFYRVIVSAE